jgi:hypothetical protein
MYETTRSVPPYSLGGTLSYRGAICAIRRRELLKIPKSPLVSNLVLSRQFARRDGVYNQ